MKLPRYAVELACAVVVFLALYSLFRGGGDAKGKADVAQSQQLEQSHRELKKLSAAVDSTVDSLGKAEKKTVARADVLRDSADRLHKVADTTSDLRVRDSVLVKENAQLRESNDSLRAALRSDSLQKFLLIADRDRWKRQADSLVVTMASLRDDYERAASRRLSRGFVAGVGACTPDRRPCGFVGYGASVRFP